MEGATSSAGNVGTLPVKALRRRRVGRALRLVLICGASLLAGAALPASAAAFDMGPHADLTFDALTREGAALGAAQVAQATNCYDDMFQIADTVLQDERAAPIHDQVDAIFGPAELRRLSRDHMHFANCPDSAALSRQWDRLLVGTWAAVQEVKQRPQGTRGLELLVVLGESLHVVQDFYAHSNWAHVPTYPGWDHPENTIRDETWFEVDGAVKAALPLTVGAHEEMGKDWPGRPHFDRAYQEAFLASWEWVRMVRAWVGEPLWRDAMSYRDYSIAQEMYLLRQLAMSVETGYWKGPGSGGDFSVLTAAALNYTAYHSAMQPPNPQPQIRDSYLVAWKRYCPAIAGDPAGKPAPDTLPAAVARPEWLAIDTLRVREEVAQGKPVDADGDPDFYAVLSVNGVDYQTNVVRDADDYTPTQWKTWAPLAPGTPVTVTYALWDADAQGDQPCDIVPGPALAWSWSGPVGELPTLVETEGADAIVRFRLVREPVTAAVLPQPGAHGWYTAPVLLALAGQDRSGAGIARLDYGITTAAGTRFTQYAAPFTVGDEGATLVRFFATDNAGNLEDAQETTLRIDSRAPAPRALNHPTVRRFRQGTLKYAVEDPLPSSGRAVATIKVKKKAGKVVKTLGGKVWQPVNTAQSVKFSVGSLKPGRYTWLVYATDYAGNPQTAIARSYLTVK